MSTSLEIAAEFGNSEILKILLPKARSKSLDFNKLMKKAVLSDDVESVRIIKQAAKSFKVRKVVKIDNSTH